MPPSFLFAGRRKGGAAVFVLTQKVGPALADAVRPQPSGARPFDRSFAGRVPPQEAFLDVLPATFVARVWHGSPNVRPKVGALVGALGVEDGKGVFEPNGNGPVEARPFLLTSQGTC